MGTKDTDRVLWPNTNCVTLGDSTLSLRATLSAQPNYQLRHTR